MNQYLIYFFVIIAVGIIFFLYLATRRKYRDPSAAKNYTKIRDKLTLREPPKPKVRKVKKDSIFEHLTLESMITGFIVLLIGAFMLPAVSQSVNDAQSSMASANVSGSIDGAASTIVGLTTVFFALAIAITIITVVFGGLRNSGLA